MDRFRLNALLVHVHDEHGQALVLWRFRVGTCQHDAVIGEVRARGPDFLAIDHPLVAILDGACLDASDVGPGSRLGEELAPDFFAAQGFFDIALLVIIGAKGNHRRHAHAKTDGERADRRVELAFFLVPDDLLHG